MMHGQKNIKLQNISLWLYMECEEFKSILKATPKYRICWFVLMQKKNCVNDIDMIAAGRTFEVEWHQHQLRQVYIVVSRLR